VPAALAAGYPIAFGKKPDSADIFKQTLWITAGEKISALGGVLGEYA